MACQLILSVVVQVKQRHGKDPQSIAPAGERVGGRLVRSNQTLALDDKKLEPKAPSPFGFASTAGVTHAMPCSRL